MSEQQDDLIHLVSEGGIAAQHPTHEQSGLVVGPSTGNEHNRINAGIIPIACWRLEDVRFEFDSSIVTSGIKTELEHLAELVRQHPPRSKSAPGPGCPLSVFGHADVVGNDDYNKVLSGRRATAVYALLTRRTELWEQLFSHPFGNDIWGTKALQIMLDDVLLKKAESGEQEGNGDSQGASQELVTQHERDAGKRKQLFAAYMRKLCGDDLKLEKEDFLAHGDDPSGKGDFQGCGEFNPVLIFSQEEQTRFQKAQDKTERNNANAPNRRVVVLIFRKGTRVDPLKWPCPRATEGVGDCHKRFWSDGEERRNKRFPDSRRKFEESKDTFACRFYQRLTEESPCEAPFDIHLPLVFDDALLGVAPGVEVELTFADGSTEKVVTDASGLIRIKAARGPFVDARYNRTGMIIEHRVFLRSPSSSSNEGAWQRLVNLGYVGDNKPAPVPPGPNDLVAAIEEFQFDFGLEVNGNLDAATQKKLRQAHDQDNRPWPKRDWPSPPVPDPNDPNRKQDFS